MPAAKTPTTAIYYKLRTLSLIIRELSKKKKNIGVDELLSNMYLDFFLKKLENLCTAYFGVQGIVFLYVGCFQISFDIDL